MRSLLGLWMCGSSIYIYIYIYSLYHVTSITRHSRHHTTRLLIAISWTGHDIWSQTVISSRPVMSCHGCHARGTVQRASAHGGRPPTDRSTRRRRAAGRSDRTTRRVRTVGRTRSGRMDGMNRSYSASCQSLQLTRPFPWPGCIPTARSAARWRVDSANKNTHQTVWRPSDPGNRNSNSCPAPALSTIRIRQDLKMHNITTWRIDECQHQMNSSGLFIYAYTFDWHSAYGTEQYRIKRSNHASISDDLLPLFRIVLCVFVFLISLFYTVSSPCILLITFYSRIINMLD